MLFDTMAANSGLVRWSGDGEFITTVDVSWHPAWRGEQRRFFSLIGDRLIVRTPEQPSPRLDGRVGVGEIVFEREGRASDFSGRATSAPSRGNHSAGANCVMALRYP